MIEKGEEQKTALLLIHDQEKVKTEKKQAMCVDCWERDRPANMGGKGSTDPRRTHFWNIPCSSGPSKSAQNQYFISKGTLLKNTC